MKILIYGLGKEALLVKEALKKEHLIVGFTDSFAKIKSYAGFRFYDRKELESINYDYIILALKHRIIVENVKDDLIKSGIGIEKIIDFRQMFARQKVDNVMRASKNEKINGIILGISCATFGINSSYLPGVWRNLARPHEDLYYHYKVLKKCTDCYSETIENLEYAIIDMFDYAVFNYDLSLTKSILNYWSCGGYAEDLHHFNENKNYTEDYMLEMKKAGYYFPIFEERDILLAERLFDMDIIENKIDYLYNAFESNGFRDYPLLSKVDSALPEEPLLPYHIFYMGEERYPETIEENKEILKNLINLLKSINPKIKIYFILMPKYGRLDDYHEILLGSYRKGFEHIMNDVLKEDNFYYHNFKQCVGIYNNHHFFFDTAHMNYYGAIAFTGLLNDWIKQTL